MPPTLARETYSVRAETDVIVQEELLIEQGKRQTLKERTSLMAIAAEWLEEKARENRKKRESA